MKLPIKISISKLSLIKLPNKQTIFRKEKRCSKCNVIKLSNEFTKDPNTSDGLSSYCRACKVIYNKEWRSSNPNWNEYRRNHRKKHREQISVYDKNKRLKLKEEFITEYGGHCACCGENNIKFLSIDHIDGNGKAHRLKLGIGRRGGSTSNVLRDMRNKGWTKR
jgi:hypothetical protein